MHKLLAFLGATFGGYGGWALGAAAGTMTAFVLSVLGTAAGVYAAHRVARHLDA